MHTENIQENERLAGSGKEIVSFEEKKEIRIVTLPEEEGYEVIYAHESGGVVLRHCLVDVESKDYEEVLDVAMDKAGAGCRVQMLPILDKDHPLRNRIFDGAKDRKCPDLKIDGIFVEIKTPTGGLHASKISNNIRDACQQADSIVIRIEEQIEIQCLERAVKGRFKSHSRLNKIEFKMGGCYYTFNRSDFT